MELKPTLFAGVPRVFERVHEGLYCFFIYRTLSTILLQLRIICIF